MKTKNMTKKNKLEVFWGEITPCEHLVQIYASDEAFLDSLEGFVYGGIRAGEGVIVIATAAHLGALNERLQARGLGVDVACSNDQYIPVDADLALSKLMVAEWPDDELFKDLVTDLITRAGKKGRRVRAFGEMVAVLWAHGRSGATVRLEYLWHTLCQEKGFSLFCAYPRIGFTQNMDTSMREICAAHSRLVPN